MPHSISTHSIVKTLCLIILFLFCIHKTLIAQPRIHTDDSTYTIHTSKHDHLNSIPFSDEFNGPALDLSKWEPGSNISTAISQSLVLSGTIASRAEVYSKKQFHYGVLEIALRSSDFVTHTDVTDSSIGFEEWAGADNRCHHGIIFVPDGHLAILRSQSDENGNCANQSVDDPDRNEADDPKYQAFVPIPNWNGFLRLSGEQTLVIKLSWTADSVTIEARNGTELIGETTYVGDAIPLEPLKLRFNADYSKYYEIDYVRGTGLVEDTTNLCATECLTYLPIFVDATPSITISAEDSNAQGSVSPSRYCNASYKVVLYAKTNDWFIQPFTTSRDIQINADCSWQSFTHSWNELSAHLVPANYEPPNVISGMGQPCPPLEASTDTNILATICFP